MELYWEFILSWIKTPSLSKDMASPSPGMTSGLPHITEGGTKFLGTVPGDATVCLPVMAGFGADKTQVLVFFLSLLRAWCSVADAAQTSLFWMKNPRLWSICHSVITWPFVWSCLCHGFWQWLSTQDVWHTVTEGSLGEFSLMVSSAMTMIWPAPGGSRVEACWKVISF